MKHQDTFHREVAKLTWVKVNHRHAQPLQLDNREALGDAVLLQSALLSFFLIFGLETDRFAEDPIFPVLLVLVARSATVQLFASIMELDQPAAA